MSDPAQLQEYQVPSASELEGIFQKQRKLLAQMQRSVAFERGDVDTALRQLTEVASQMLRVDRASVWRFDFMLSEIQCVNLFQRAARVHGAGTALSERDFPAYFSALREERTIAAHDAGSDLRTSEFRDVYLRPNGIGAMLDAPILVGGRMVGVVCHEHVGGPRRWQFWEELVAASMADFVALVLLARERARQDEELRRHRDELGRLVEERTRELGESQEGFRKLFEVSPVPLLLTSMRDDRFLGGNERASDVFGLRATEAVGQATSDYHADPAERRQLMDLVRTQGHVYGFEATLRAVDGRTFPAALSAQTLVASGEPAILVGVQDLTKQKETERQLLELAIRDALTGLFNRRHFFEVGRREVERASRYERALSLAMIDVDHFKGINDEHGHTAGDTTLVALARASEGVLRRSDVLSRYGGEELCILFPETDLEAAATVVERLRAAVEALPIATDAGIVRCTVSAGVATRRPDETLESMLNRADSALYAAKEAGRNRVKTAV
jgi:diguanylate cyclase (GGDEF)-like protein/PAS domain S-box-containing protein